MPSVTQVLDVCGLIPRYPERKIYLARGLAVHKATELYDRGRLARLDERLEGWITGWKKFRRDTGFEPTLIEHRVASLQYLYCGTTDRVGLLNGDLTVLDIKSGAVAAYAALQTAGYKRGLDETEGLHAKRRVAVQLTEQGTYKVTEYHDHSTDERLWLSAVALYRWREEHRLI